MISFESDYCEGCIPEILTALQSSNPEQTPGYGEDAHCIHARKLIQKAIGNSKAMVQFLVGGTQANATVIDHVCKPYQGVLCAATGHINCHETGAVEATGHKCLPLDSQDGTITAKQVETAITQHFQDESFEHLVQPGMVYISFPTENGTLYSKKQLQELYAICKTHHIPLFIDGARLGYGLVAKANDCTLQDIAKNCDVFYIGGTKVGALFGEAVVFTNLEIAKYFRYSIKQHGGMLAKGRLLGIQFETLFEKNRYFTISKHAMDCAEALRKALVKKGYAFAYPPQTNQLFPILPNAKIKQLRKNFAFHTWGPVDSTHTTIRLVTSFQTSKESVQKLIQAL